MVHITGLRDYHDSFINTQVFFLYIPFHFLTKHLKKVYLIFLCITVEISCFDFPLRLNWSVSPHLYFLLLLLLSNR